MDLDLSNPSLRPPLQERTMRLVQEACWALAAFCAVYLALILFGFHLSDPGWSHAVANGVVMNPGGRFGAFVSDVLLYFFAHAAWWWVVLLIYVPIRSLRLWRNREDRRPFYVSMLGFVLLLAGSCAMESLHFYHRDATLPYASGGVLGLALARFSFNYFGFVGSTLGLLVVLAVGASLFFNFSWLSFCEKLGHLLESAAAKISAYWQARQDRRIGREMTLVRENKVEIAREKEQVHLPLHIEEPKLEIRPSPQIIKERQKPLFPDMPAQIKPPLELLAKAEEVGDPVSKETLEFTSRQIERKLSDFGVEAQVIGAYPGPVVARYELQPAVGVKGSQVINLAKDLARSLSAASVRIVETIPGKSCMGLELPNPSRQKVSLSQVLGSRTYYDSKSPLPLGLGKDIAGQPVVVDLVRMPHLLVAGTTGSGKSVGINAMILSILYKTEVKDVRMILVDPKMLELGVYDGIGHLLSPVVTDMRLAAQALGWCVREMERRYQILSVLGVRNIAGFNQRLADASKRGEVLVDPTKENGAPLTHLPYIVVVIDELADLMMVAGKQVEEHIARIAQKARAAGIHLILATQRPSVDVITGLIKANIPTRISFQVSSKIDSRTILDQMGAESLLGQGDMLFLEPGIQTPMRVHGAWVSDEEVHKVVEYLKRHGPPPAYEDFKEAAAQAGEGAGSSDDPSMEADPLYDQAVEVVLRARRASISLVQRHLRIGYNRSARLIERMEKEGLVSIMSSNGSREVLAPASAAGTPE